MGTDAAPMEIPEGGKTGVELALLARTDQRAGSFIWQAAALVKAG